MNSKELLYKVFDWLRFPLMVFVVYIHSTGRPPINYDLDFFHLTDMNYYDLFRISIYRVLTQVAVPSFFFISGYLFFNKLNTWNWKTYRKKLQKRVKTLLIPFLLWNTIAILVHIQHSFRHEGIMSVLDFFQENNYWELYWDSDTWAHDRVNWLGLPIPMSSPFLVPLWYLRDLMVMMVLSPVFWYLFKYTHKWGLILLAASYITDIGLNKPGLYDTAFFFYGAGAYFNLNNINVTTWTWKYRKGLYILTFVLWGITTISYGIDQQMGFRIQKFYVIIGCIATFNAATFFIQKKLYIPTFLVESTFFIYMAHTIRITGKSMSLMRKVFEQSNPLLMSAGYILSPLLTVTICVVGYLLLKRYMPKVCGILTGDRASNHIV